MPSAMLRQSVVWTAGFSNYATSIFLTLIYIYFIIQIFNDEKPKYSNHSIFPLFLLGACNTLIVEHMTAFNVVLSSGVIGFVLIKFKKVYWQHISYFIGCIAGTIYMLSNSVYRSVAEGNDTYRTIGIESLIRRCISNFINVIARDGFLYNVFLNTFICLFCFTLLLQTAKKLKSTKRVLFYLSFGMIFLYTAYSYLSKYLSRVNGNGGIFRKVDGIVVILFVIALFVFLLLLPIIKEEKWKTLFFFSSSMVCIAPLFVVTPIGSRCLFASYIFFTLLTTQLLKILIESIKENSSKTNLNFYKPAFNFLRKVLLLVCVGAFGFLFFIYGSIYNSNLTRLEKIQADVNRGLTTINVENLPYTGYVWTGNPTEETVWEERFKLFYEIGENIKIKNISYKVK